MLGGSGGARVELGPHLESHLWHTNASKCSYGTAAGVSSSSFSLSCKLLFFFFKILPLLPPKSLSARSVTYNIYFQVADTGVTSPITHFYTRKGEMRELSNRKAGLFLNLSRAAFGRNVCDIFVEGVQGRTVLESRARSVPTGLSFPLLRRHLLLAWRYRCPSIKVRMGEKVGY